MPGASALSTEDVVHTASWSYAAGSADEFLDGVLGTACGVRYLSHEELAEVFPELQQVRYERAVSSLAAECNNHCTCGACLVIQGQVACTACYACCADGKDCQSDCESNINAQKVTSSCDCVTPPPPTEFLR